MTKILIIDDVDYIRKSITKVLEANDFQCETCENGKIAMEKVQSSDYDLIISDMMMPEVDGFEFMEFLRGLPEPKKNIPVLAISGGSKTINPEMALSMVNEHANDILQKPFGKESLLKAVNKVLNSANLKE
jgi:CheY-like chemotaxis protein